MTATATHFKVGNGDMALFTMDDGHSLLVDINIRSGADDPDNGDVPDVAGQLRDRLVRDNHGRLYVDAFLLTHPDADHCTGLREHFHLGPLSDWSRSADKIVIREMWSSPLVFRRASSLHVLCEDACAWSAEARRRVRMHREKGFGAAGDLVTIMGKDTGGKTDDIMEIVCQVDDEFDLIAGDVGAFRARLIAPMPADDDAEAEVLSKNNSSVIMTLDLRGDHVASAARYLIGGDAEVEIWEKVWKRNKNQAHLLEYDVLVAPHHCSWRSLSHYSWSTWGEAARVSEDAKSALGQARQRARILTSSKTISDDDSDPPSTRARREYRSMLQPVIGDFQCIADHAGDQPYEIEVSYAGHKPKRPRLAAAVAAGTGIGSQPLPHG